VRLLYIRAQVTRIDLKIDLALEEILKRYKRLIRDATGSVFAPMGATITRKVSTNAITKSIINCFGLPTVGAETALEALNANVWKTLGTNMILALAESFHLVGLAASGSMSGAPIWLATGTINASYVVPATCRLFLMMACDLTFVLARSFKEVTFRSGGMPGEKEVAAAARNYRIRGYSQHVHKDIKQLVPRRNILKSFKACDVGSGIEAIFLKYKDKLMEDVDLPLRVGSLRIGSQVDLVADADADDNSTEADSTIFNDIREAASAFKSLEAGVPVDEVSIAELDSNAPVELPGDSRPVSELAHSPSTVKKPVAAVELAHSPSTVKKPPKYELEG
jgi:hypothetical protein